MELRCSAPTGKNGTFCGGRLGELPVRPGHEAQFAGVVRFWNDRLAVIPDIDARDARHCHRCGWYTLFLVQNGDRPPAGRRARIPMAS